LRGSIPVRFRGPTALFSREECSADHPVSEEAHAAERVRTAASAEEAEVAYREAERLLDRAARKNLVAKNNAARQKSRLLKAVRGKSKK
jgi:hypothetical protein